MVPAGTVSSPFQVPEQSSPLLLMWKRLVSICYFTALKKSQNYSMGQVGRDNSGLFGRTSLLKQEPS